MKLRYTKKDGTQTEFELGDRPITIGRSPDADVVILDDKASRLHCGIRLWDGDFYVKDLKSRNGTYVNGEQIDVAKLGPGDRIQIGDMSFVFDQAEGPGAETVLHEVEQEMADGKGYSTILREIVSDINAPPPESEEAPAREEEPTPPPAVKRRAKSSEP